MAKSRSSNGVRIGTDPETGLPVIIPDRGGSGGVGATPPDRPTYTRTTTDATGAIVEVEMTDWKRVIEEQGVEAVPLGVAAQLLAGGEAAPRVKAPAPVVDPLVQFGQPAALGAVAGAVVALLVGQEPVRGALYGAGAGLAFGWWRGGS